MSRDSSAGDGITEPIALPTLAQPGQNHQEYPQLEAARFALGLSTGEE
jgi:hypothetical protein